MRCCSRSSADPPGGNRTSPAAIRFAASNTPSTVLTRVCGSRNLKFLSIVHGDPVAVQRLILRGRQRAMTLQWTEQRRFFQLLEKTDRGFRLLHAYHHVEKHFVLGVDLRKTNRDQLDIVWQHALDIGKYFGPTDRLTLQQLIQQQAALQDLGVGRLAQERVQFRLLGGYGPDLGV